MINNTMSSITKAIITLVPRASIIPVEAATNNPIKNDNTTAIIPVIIHKQKQSFLHFFPFL